MLRSRLRGTPHPAENTWLFPSTTGRGRTHRDVSVTAGASLHSGLLLWNCWNTLARECHPLASHGPGQGPVTSRGRLSSNSQRCHGGRQHPGLILPRAQRSPKKRRLAHDAVDPGLRMLSVPSFSADNVAICLPSLNSALLEAAQMPQPGLQSRVD